MPPSPFARNSAGVASSRLDENGILNRFIDVLPPTLGALVRQMPPIKRLPVLIKTFPAPDSLLDSLGNPVGASDAYTRLFTLFIRIWVYFVQQAVNPEFVLPTEFPPPTPSSESGLRRGLGLLILSLDDFRLRYRICANEAIQRNLAPPRFVSFRPNLAIRFAFSSIFFATRTSLSSMANRPIMQSLLACVLSRSIFFMAGVAPPRSYLGDNLILEITELLPGPDLIAPPLVPGTFSLDVLFAFSLRPAVHSLHAFVINSFFRPFSFRAVSEAELVQIRQAVRALADVLWAVFVGRSSLCMVHGGHVNPDQLPDVVIPAQAASMLRIFESILDHYGYYLPDGTESPEMTALHVMIVHGLHPTLLESPCNFVGGSNGYSAVKPAEPNWSQTVSSRLLSVGSDRLQIGSAPRFSCSRAKPWQHYPSISRVDFISAACQAGAHAHVNSRPRRQEWDFIKTVHCSVLDLCREIIMPVLLAWLELGLRMRVPASARGVCTGDRTPRQICTLSKIIHRGFDRTYVSGIRMSSLTKCKLKICDLGAATAVEKQKTPLETYMVWQRQRTRLLILACEKWGIETHYRLDLELVARSAAPLVENASGTSSWVAMVPLQHCGDGLGVRRVIRGPGKHQALYRGERKRNEVHTSSPSEMFTRGSLGYPDVLAQKEKQKQRRPDISP
ncbi:hypothetical protein C8F01DRAFT_1081525 [Mycena amicta]|nr:hypothetical protein C8F01DRAFT_1081525 [Mycena amicta]